MIDIKRIADEADVIISGYAFKKVPDEIKVFNLNNCKSAAVFQPDGTLMKPIWMKSNWKLLKNICLAV